MVPVQGTVCTRRGQVQPPPLWVVGITAGGYAWPGGLPQHTRSWVLTMAGWCGHRVWLGRSITPSGFDGVRPPHRAAAPAGPSAARKVALTRSRIASSIQIPGPRVSPPPHHRRVRLYHHPDYPGHAPEFYFEKHNDAHSPRRPAHPPRRSSPARDLPHPLRRLIPRRAGPGATRPKHRAPLAPSCIRQHGRAAGAPPRILCVFNAPRQPGREVRSGSSSALLRATPLTANHRRPPSSSFERHD